MTDPMEPFQTVHIDMECETCGAAYQSPVVTGRILHDECPACRGVQHEQTATERHAETAEEIRTRLAVGTIFAIGAFILIVLLLAA